MIFGPENTLDSNRYTKGELSIAFPRCEDSQNCKHDHAFHYATEPTVYLPHSCSEWKIGGEAEVNALIEDLTDALRRMKGTTK